MLLSDIVEEVGLFSERSMWQDCIAPKERTVRRVSEMKDVDNLIDSIGLVLIGNVRVQKDVSGVIGIGESIELLIFWRVKDFGVAFERGCLR